MFKLKLKLFIKKKTQKLIRTKYLQFKFYRINNISTVMKRHILKVIILSPYLSSKLFGQHKLQFIYCVEVTEALSAEK